MFQKIIQEYQNIHQNNLERELCSFSELKNYDEMINRVAYCIDSKGKQYPHQRRITREAHDISHQILNTLSFNQFNDFDSLYNYLKANLLQKKGIGPLYIYDASLKIGAFYKLEPEKIYLHAGTLKGAKNLKWNTSKGYLTLQDLPTDLQRISPKYVEAILCIYKDCFKDGKVNLNACRDRQTANCSGLPFRSSSC